MTRPLLSTYRLQLGPDFTFSDAENTIGYLAQLGVSHLYLSPILTATTGSTHGYDVTDPTTVSEVLGGRAGFEQLVAKAHRHNMGIVIDIVPNHLGVAVPCENKWWWDVLTYGRKSQYASFFDIDFSDDNGADGKIALPVLGSTDDLHELRIRGNHLEFYDHSFPICPGSVAPGYTPEMVHDAQSYRLVPWDCGIITYRRFFAVNTLAAIRQEAPEVFEHSHREVATWCRNGWIDGVRIDHPDGLADPAGYLTSLRAIIGDRWLVIEKILADHSSTENLEPSLPVDGTTGYDSLRECGGVLVDPAGVATLTTLCTSLTGEAFDEDWLHAAEHDRKIVSAATLFPAEFRRLARAVKAASETRLDPDDLLPALVEVVASTPVYRSDYPNLAGLTAEIVDDITARSPELSPGLAALSQALTEPEIVSRLAQVTGAVTAKSVEDCIFYRMARLTSLQEVGGNPGRFNDSVQRFHLKRADRARYWPRAMTTLSTHDTKRSEDVRARISVLSQVADEWSTLVMRWHELIHRDLDTPMDPTTELFMWQTMFGVWPRDGVPSAALRTRIHNYATKAMREAEIGTTWTDINDDFETVTHRFIDAVIDGPIAREMTDFLTRVLVFADSDALAQKLLHLVGPGVPDTYQGTEIWDDSLVDPDNRRAVNFSSERGDHPKYHVTRTVLHVRRERAHSFIPGSNGGGEYEPIYANGIAADHVIACRRGVDVIAVAMRFPATFSQWGETTIALPDGRWADRINDCTHSAKQIRLDDLISPSRPVALLVKEG